MNKLKEDMFAVMKRTAAAAETSEVTEVTVPDVKKSAEKIKEIPKLYMEFHTDGSSLNSGKQGAGSGTYGFTYTVKSVNGEDRKYPVEYVESVEILPLGATNNAAELQAAITGMEQIKHREKELTSAVLLTDSMYAINCVTQWYDGWVKRNWVTSQGESVKNRDRIEKLYEIYNSLEIPCEFKWEKGHCEENKENGYADLLAGAGSRKTLEGSYGKTILTWSKKEYPCGGLIKLPHAFYSYCYIQPRTTNVVEVDGKSYNAYAGGYHQDSINLFGKKHPYQYLAVSYLKKPIQALESIRKDCKDFCPMDSSIAYGNMATIRNGRNYTWFMNGMSRTSDKGLFVGDQLLVAPANPPLLALRGISGIVKLSGVLTSFLKGDSDYETQFYDITDQFYTKTESAKGVISSSLRKDIRDKIVVNRNVTLSEVEASEVPFNISIGIDSPNRNGLYPFAHSNAKVYLAIWKLGPTLIEYGTIYEDDDGYSINSATDSNLILIVDGAVAGSKKKKAKGGKRKK